MMIRITTLNHFKTASRNVMQTEVRLSQRLKKIKNKFNLNAHETDRSVRHFKGETICQ